jgi:hypothetical protein
MRSVRRLTRTALATLGVLAGGLAVTATPALAVNKYGFTGAFGTAGSGSGQFKEPEGVAVSELGATKGDVYVVDKGNNRVEWFNSTGGKLEGQFDGSSAPTGALSNPRWIAVDNDVSSASKEDVYVTGEVQIAGKTSQVVYKFSSAGAYISQLTKTTGGALFGELLGVAVDPDGNVWIYDSNSNVDEFSDTGSFVRTFNTGRKTNPGLAVDSSEDVYLVPGGRVGVSKWDPTTGAEITEFSGGVSGLAINPATNNLFVDQASGIAEWSLVEPYEKPIEEFGSKALSDSGGSGIAVSTTGAAYVADSAVDRVDVFTAAPVASAAPEAPLTEAASGETASSAVLHGELNLGAKAEAGWYFAYNLGVGCTGGSTTLAEPEAEVQAVKEEKLITGLEPSAQYTFCLVAENTFGSTFGLPKTLTTSPVPPKVDGESAAGIKSTEATLEAQVNPNNEKTNGYLQYSTSATVNGSGSLIGAAKTASSGLGEGYGDQPLAPAALTGLTAGTTYYYQAVASNAAGTTYGTVQEFTTVPAPATEAPSPIGTTTATLNGTLTPLNLTVATEYFFLYNLGEAPVCTGEHETAHESAGTGSAAKAVSKAVNELQPNQKYTVCLFSVNAFGSEEDMAPVHFTTSPVPPSVESESASTVASETTPAAGLGAQINPNNEETTCTFEYGAEPLLKAGTTTSVPCEQVSLGNGFGAQTASAHIENLEAGKTYYYRVVAENAQSKTEGKPTHGAIEHFTASVVPTVATGAAQGPTRTSIVLAGTVNPNGVATSYHFAYIDEAGYQAALSQHARGAGGDPYSEGATTAPLEAGEGTAPVEFEVPAKGLLPGTTYHYVLVASNATSTITGADETFTTAAATPPIVTTGAASEVTLSTATIAGTLSTQGLDVGYAFEVSTELGNPGPPSGGGSIGAGPTEASVSIALQGLQPGTTYYYRLLATSTDGTSYGATQAFTTPGFPSLLVLPATPPLIGTPAIAFPTETGTAGKSTTKSLTNAQKLARALKACAKKPKSKRAACRKQAHKKYPPAKKKKK